jgi:hypothetical protein
MAALVSKANDLRSAPVPLLTDTGELPSEPVHFENLQPLRSTFDALLERFYEESASSKRKGGGLSSLLSKDKTAQRALFGAPERAGCARAGRRRRSCRSSHRSMRATAAPTAFVREVQQIATQLSVIDEFVHNLT